MAYAPYAASGQNKGAIIASLMRQAVKEAERHKIAEEAYRRLTEGRSERGSLTSEEARRARTGDRP